MRRLIGFSMLVLFLTSCKPQEELLREQRAADEAAAALENKPAMESQVAKTGVGIKGDSLEGTSSSNPASMVSAPALAYFKLKERVVFEIQLPKQMDLFKAYHGRPPRNHEEYMKEVVTNQIKLPLYRRVWFTGIVPTRPNFGLSPKRTIPAVRRLRHEFAVFVY